MIKVEFIIQSTFSLYEEMLAIPEEDRATFYENMIIQPFHELAMMNMLSNPKCEDMNGNVA